MFCRKGVLRNFAKFTGKQLCQSYFFNKVAGLRTAIFLKKRLWRRCFPVNFAKFLRTSFFTEHLRCLLLCRKTWKFSSVKYSAMSSLLMKKTSSPRMFFTPKQAISSVTSLREKCPYSELFWSAFCRIQTEYGEILRLSVFSPNAGKYGPE